MIRRIFKPKAQCLGCRGRQSCSDTAVSWVLLFVGVIATISVRVVNLALSYGLFWSKLFWYVGVTGFFLYFLYKFREDRTLRRQLSQRRINEKISGGMDLDRDDMEFLRAMTCRLRSNKDAINYFFIFLSSAIVMALAVYEDFIKV